MTDNPFGVAEEELLDRATTDYVTTEDLDGRLVLIYCDEIRQESGTSGPYLKCICDTVVLDGEVTEKIPEVPFVVEGMHISNSQIVDKLKKRVGNPKPLLGRMNAAPSKRNKKVMAVWIVDPKDDDIPVAVAYLKANPRKTDDPFATS